MGRKARAPIGPRVGKAADAVAEAAEEVPWEWWHALQEDDPITLEPLKKLNVPPFGLVSNGVTQYFDAVALASYITRRAVFENPLNREAISREDCARLDEHIGHHVPESRAFRVADALDLQQAIRAKRAGGSRSAAALRREASAALQGLFDFPSLHAAGTLTSALGDGGMIMVDDDIQRHIEAEAIAAMHAAAAAEAARPGGAMPEASLSNFPELSLEASLAGDRLSAVIVEGDGFLRAAEAMADEAAREARRRAAEEAARRAAAKEAAAHMETANRAAKLRFLEAQRRREVLQADAAAMAVEHLSEVRRQNEEQQAEVLRAAVVEATAIAEKRDAEYVAAVLRREEEERCDEEELAAAARQRAEEERQKAEEKKKEREAEKKRRQKEKERLEKEKAAAEQAKQELEAAKQAASLRCAMCGEGILGKNFFEVNGQKFCSTACVKKKRESAS